tara:strand:- start:163 stop:1419 length:1257 start_codon:yes stop_codon:yes gene_type:complete
MDKFVINGDKKLIGEVKISGAKNAVLPIMAACILKPATYTIRNVPNLKDTRTMIKLLEESGANVKFNNNILVVDSTECNNPVAPYELVKTMRASFYMLGPFIARFGKSTVSLPGGCAWGPRPVDFHIKALKEMGARVELKDGNILCTGNLKGTEINFKKKSVGATGNIIMAAVGADGETVITNASCEPEIEDLCNFITLLGVNIDGIGTDVLKINSSTDMVRKKIEYSVIPDRIEAATFMILAAITKGDIKLKNVNINHLDIVMSKLKSAGVEIEIINSHTLRVKNSGDLLSVDVETKEYPGFPTDIQAQWMSLMCLATGSSKIKENIYSDRFTHVAELSRFGADVTVKGDTAYINGVTSFRPAPVMSTDIRASASLILAALSSEGESTISRIYHIDRGYENIEEKIAKLGGIIRRKK